MSGFNKSHKRGYKPNAHGNYNNDTEDQKEKDARFHLGDAKNGHVLEIVTKGLVKRGNLSANILVTKVLPAKVAGATGYGHWCYTIDDDGSLILNTHKDIDAYYARQNRDDIEDEDGDSDDDVDENKKDVEKTGTFTSLIKSPTRNLFGTAPTASKPPDQRRGGYTRLVVPGKEARDTQLEEIQKARKGMMRQLAEATYTCDEAKKQLECAVAGAEMAVQELEEADETDETGVKEARARVEKAEKLRLQCRDEWLDAQEALMELQERLSELKKTQESIVQDELRAHREMEMESKKAVDRILEDVGEIFATLQDRCDRRANDYLENDDVFREAKSQNDLIRFVHVMMVLLQGPRESVLEARILARKEFEGYRLPENFSISFAVWFREIQNRYMTYKQFGGSMEDDERILIVKGLLNTSFDPLFDTWRNMGAVPANYNEFERLVRSYYATNVSAKEACMKNADNKAKAAAAAAADKKESTPMQVFQTTTVKRECAFYKTAKGCIKGDKCNFAHGPVSKGRAVCFDMRDTGVCSNKDCPFSATHAIAKEFFDKLQK